MPNQKLMKWVLPDVVHPLDTVCFQINVPNNRAYIGAFMGAIFLLSKPYAWGDDADHTALEVGAVWRAIFDELIAGNCTTCPPGQLGGIMEDFEVPLRVDCDCNVFVTCCDGTEKQILTADQVRALVAGQPGDANSPPGPGQCRLYDFSIEPPKFYLVPFLVSTGDVLTLSALDGATTDGAPFGRWNCPSGDLFLGGTCQGVPQTDASAPAPSLPIGIPLYLINSTYYDARSPLTVPGSISNQQCAIVINYATGGSYGGKLTGRLEVCNNQAGTFSHRFDLATGPQGWFPYDTGGAQFFGNYVVGSGYEDTDAVASGLNGRGVAITVSFPSRNLTGVTVEYDFTLGTVDSGGAVIQNVADNVVNYIIHHSGDAVVGTDVIDSGNAASTAQTVMRLQYLSDVTAGARSGSVLIRAITIRGTGTDPF